MPHRAANRATLEMMRLVRQVLPAFALLLALLHGVAASASLFATAADVLGERDCCVESAHPGAKCPLHKSRPPRTRDDGQCRLSCAAPSAGAVVLVVMVLDRPAPIVPPRLAETVTADAVPAILIADPQTASPPPRS